MTGELPTLSHHEARSKGHPTVRVLADRVSRREKQMVLRPVDKMSLRPQLTPRDMGSFDS